MYPVAYKQLLEVLRSGDGVALRTLVGLFPAIRAEIESNRGEAHVIDEGLHDDLRMDYQKAREIVSITIEQPGTIEIADVVHDSVDDCADLLMDLDQVERMEEHAEAGDVWWCYVFGYDSHYGGHMDNLEEQRRWLTRR